MTHPTNTAILSDDEIEKIARFHGTGGWQTLPDMIRFARAVIEKLGASDAHAAAFYHPPSDEDPNEGLSFKWYGNAEPLYDATALAAARQQGRNEGREAARAEETAREMICWELLEGIVHFSDGFSAYREGGVLGQELSRWVEGARSALAARQPTQKEAT